MTVDLINEMSEFPKALILLVLYWTSFEKENPEESLKLILDEYL